MGGNDTLTGGGGRDIISGGDGADIITHTVSSNFFSYLFTSIEGGAGGDTITLNNSSNAKISYKSSPKAVTINLTSGLISGGHATGDVFNDVRSLGGSSKNDTLTGNDDDNFLGGEDGDDILRGKGGSGILQGDDGNDTLRGDAQDNTLGGSNGDDLLVGGRGDDLMLGGSGNDTMKGGAGDDRFSSSAGFDSFDGGKGTDTVSYFFDRGDMVINLKTGVGAGGDAEGDVYQSIENVTGGYDDDRIIGTLKSNELDGDDGDDILKGNGGNDILEGGDGNDKLVGGKGDDRLLGDNGDDILIGGAGHGDVFVFRVGFLDTSFGNDTIRGFSGRNKEKIDLADIDDIISFADLTQNHLTSDGATGFAKITSDVGSILLTGYSIDDTGDGKAISGADFLF